MTLAPLARRLAVVHQRAEALLKHTDEAASHALRDGAVAEPTQAALLGQTWREVTSTLAELLTVHEAFQTQPPRHPDLLEFEPDGYLVTDTAGLIHEANEAAAQLFELPLAGLAGKRLVDLVAAEETPALAQDLSEITATQTSKHRETRLRPTVGPPFEGLYVVVPARDAQGGIAELRWLVWDLSERKRQEQVTRLARQTAEQATVRANRLQAVMAGLVEALTADQVLATVVFQGAAALGPAAGVLNLLSADGLHLTTVGAGHPESLLEQYREFPITDAQPGADVLRTGEPLWIESFQDFQTRYPSLAPAGATAGVEAVAVLPLLADRQPLGALAVSFAEPRAFSPEDQAFLLTLAGLSAQALARNRALAVENTRLRQEIVERRQQQAASDHDRDHLRIYAEGLARAREQERRRLALDLHDQIGGALTALKMDMFSMRQTLGRHEPALSTRMEAMSSYISETIALVRALATELRPAMLDDLGLPAALEWAASQFEKRFGIPCRWVTNTDEGLLDAEHATAIYRVVQECLTNVVRHAQASAVTIKLVAQADSLTVSVDDNGRGFEYDPQARLHTLGLAGLHERMLAIGGTVEIESAPGAGTLVRLWVGRTSAPL